MTFLHRPCVTLSHLGTFESGAAAPTPVEGRARGKEQQAIQCIEGDVSRTQGWKFSLQAHYRGHSIPEE